MVEGQAPRLVVIRYCIFSYSYFYSFFLPFWDVLEKKKMQLTDCHYEVKDLKQLLWHKMCPIA